MCFTFMRQFLLHNSWQRSLSRKSSSTCYWPQLSQPSHTSPLAPSSLANHPPKLKLKVISPNALGNKKREAWREAWKRRETEHLSKRYQSPNRWSYLYNRLAEVSLLGPLFPPWEWGLQSKIRTVTETLRT